MQQISAFIRSMYNRPAKTVVTWFAIILGVLLAVGYWFSEDTFAEWWISACVIHLLGGLYSPVWRLEYTLLTVVTYPIGWVVSLVLLALVYFFVLTPIGLLKRRKKEAPGWHVPEALLDGTKMYG